MICPWSDVNQVLSRAEILQFLSCVPAPKVHNVHNVHFPFQSVCERGRPESAAALFRKCLCGPSPLVTLPRLPDALSTRHAAPDEINRSAS